MRDLEAAFADLQSKRKFTRARLSHLTSNGRFHTNGAREATFFNGKFREESEKFVMGLFGLPAEIARVGH